MWKFSFKKSSFSILIKLQNIRQFVLFPSIQVADSGICHYCNKCSLAIKISQILKTTISSVSNLRTEEGRDNWGRRRFLIRACLFPDSLILFVWEGWQDGRSVLVVDPVWDSFSSERWWLFLRENRLWSGSVGSWAACFCLTGPHHDDKLLFSDWKNSVTVGARLVPHNYDVSWQIANL